MAEEPKPDDIKDILADLDAILSGLGPPGAAPPSPAAAAPSSEPPAAKPPVSAVPPKAAVPMAPTAQKPPPPPAPVQPVASKPPAQPTSPTEKTPDKMKIELAPRAGMIVTPQPQAPPKPAATPSGEPHIGKALPPMTPPSSGVTGSTFVPPKPSPSQLVTPPAAAAPTPVVKPPAATPAPAASPPSVTPAPTTPAPQPIGRQSFLSIAGAALGPKGAYEVLPSIESQIPSGIPKDQIRAVAFLFVVGQDGKFHEFLQFLDSVALNVSKKPLYIHKALVVRINPEVGDFQGMLEKVKAAQALGVIGLLQGLAWTKVKDIQEIFKGGELFFRSIEGEDALKRSSIVDLVVELMLLGPG